MAVLPLLLPGGPLGREEGDVERLEGVRGSWACLRCGSGFLSVACLNTQRRRQLEKRCHPFISPRPGRWVKGRYPAGGTQGKCGNHDLAVVGDIGPLLGLYYFCSCGLFRKLIWWEENTSWIQQINRKTKCVTLRSTSSLSFIYNLKMGKD